MAECGAFAFGVVLGWFVYFTNRYRKGDVQFSDLIALLGVIGGAAVTALFGGASGTLFGYYGVGLAVGFFAYFLVLVLMVARSDQFDATWFLDGRRKALPDGWVIPGDVRATTAPMAPQRPGPSAAAPMAFGAPEPVGPSTESPRARLNAARDQTLTALTVAQRELLRRIGLAPTDAERNSLQASLVDITDQLDTLAQLRLKDILESDEVRASLKTLEGITSDLTRTAGEMRQATDVLTKASQLIDRATKAVGVITNLVGGIL
ncbi:hypothetical protein [Cupriavidus campinensis]|jgi:hypothetical protein